MSRPLASGTRAMTAICPLFRDLEEQARGPLPEDVENDLDADHARIFDRLQRLLDPFDADAVVADLAGSLQPVERVERLRMVIEVGRRAVELDEVERFDLEVFQASLDPAAQVLVTVAGDRLLRQAAPRLGRDKHIGVRPRAFRTLATSRSERPSP